MGSGGDGWQARFKKRVGQSRKALPDTEGEDLGGHAKTKERTKRAREAGRRVNEGREAGTTQPPAWRILGTRRCLREISICRWLSQRKPLSALGKLQ